MIREFKTLKTISEFHVSKERRLHSATHEEIIQGATTDVYFVKTYEMLKAAGLQDTQVTCEVFASRKGVMAGTEECVSLLSGLGLEVWGLPEGLEFEEKEVVLRITGPYGAFGIYETAILGILASASGWATAARECKNAAGNVPFFCFGARHVHPAVAPVMERAAIIGGAAGASCILGAKLLGREPTGTIPHAVVLIMGDTVKAALLYDQIMPPSSKRIILVDTFKDEAEETLRVAEVLGKNLEGVRLDTPSERGGVTPGLVREVRSRLDQAGFQHVSVFVSGGVTPERIPALVAAGTGGFGIGSYIAGAKPIDMTMDIKEIEGRPIAKRGRIPGRTYNPRLERLL